MSTPASVTELLQDPARLDALRRLSLLDTPGEPAFDRLTRLATQILNTPIALVSLLDVNRQFFKSALGLPEPWASQRETPLSHSFCQHTMATREPLIIEDATRHPLVRDNLAIPDLGVIAYAGIPLFTPTGDAVGSFCVIDTVPRKWQDRELNILRDLAASVMTEIALRAELIERHLAEAALRDTEAKYEALFDRSMDAVYITDLTGNFLDANIAALNLLGYSRDEMSPLSFSTLLDKAQLPEALSIMEEVVRTGAQQKISAYCLKTKAGDDIHVETLSALIYREGEPWAIQGIARDVTAHKQIEATLQGAYAKEKELSALRTRFMRMMSHDFRTPLSVILTSSELLKRHADRMTPEQHHRHLEKIQGQVERLNEMLSDGMLLSQTQATALQLTRAAMNWERFGRQLAEDMQQLAGSSCRVEFHYTGDGTDGFADERWLRRAVVNLLSNAIKYSEPEGTVTFDLICHGNQVTMCIRDQGIGISQEDLMRLGETFYRASNVGDRPGQGLGLSIVKQAVEAHGGSLTVESQVDVGSVFTISIPNRPDAV